LSCAGFSLPLAHRFPFTKVIETVDSASEIVALVDEQNRVVGSATRAEMRARSLPHRATYILVFNSRGDLYVLKRAVTKDTYPGYYEVVAGGVVLSGETYEEGARREVEEELGIRNVALEPLFDFPFIDGENRIWGRAYACVYDGRIVLQEEEVESGSFHSVSEVMEMAERLPFTPDGQYVLRRYLDGTE
jgi:8-oxo-dGTP pyrophosphatase MutT (NUDIX family)